jgi:hypothetical protein
MSRTLTGVEEAPDVAAVVVAWSRMGPNERAVHVPASVMNPPSVRGRAPRFAVPGGLQGGTSPTRLPGTRVSARPEATLPASRDDPREGHTRCCVVDPVLRLRLGCK